MTHLAPEQQRASTETLPSSFEEFAAGYDPGLRDRLVETVRELDYDNGAAEETAEHQRVPPRATRYADSEAVVLGYTVSIALVGQEEWCESYTWELYADLIDIAWNPDVGSTTEIYMPSDTGDKITSHTDLDAEELDAFMEHLDTVASTFDVEADHRKGGAGGGLPSSSAAVVAAAEHCPTNTVYATYSSHARRMAEEYPGIEAAEPADIYVGLMMNKGEYDVPELNRVHSTIAWFAPVSEHRQETVPPDLKQEHELGRADAAVIDESAGMDVSLRRNRVGADWSDTLDFIHAAVTDKDVEVYVPEGLPQDMKEDIGGDPGRRVRDDLAAVTHQLSVLDPSTLDIPAKFEGEEGDYAIAEAAKEVGDHVLVATYDDDFVEIPGLVAAAPDAATPHPD